jgi:methyl-accepting chemotaxis protein
MRLTISKKLYAGFGAVLLFMAVIGVLGWRATVELGATVETLHENNLKAAVHLANAQDTLWRLRYAISQFQVVKPDQQQKLIAEEPKHYAQLKKQIQAYAAGRRSAEERAAIKEWDEIWEKYPAARMKWYELASAGKSEEAAAWRAANTTPYGNASVKTLTRMIDLQRSAADAEAADAAAHAKRTIALLVTLIAAGLVVSAGAAWMIARSVTKPLAETAATMREISVQRDLTKRVTVIREDELAEVAESFNLLIGTIEEAVMELREGARQMAAASQHVSEASHQLSDGVQQQAAGLEETAASLEQLTGTARQTADNARQANELAEGSREVAENGGKVVTEAVTSMGAINASSKKIAEIITTIDEIAFQTNLLALNAAVEAARAGDQGRGFAVVASEVRNLAQRSASAAREIKELIQDSVAKVGVGSQLVDRSGQTLGEIVGSVKRVKDIVAEIAAASREQTTGIDQVNVAITRMDKQVQNNAGQTRELSETAQALATQAERLSELVGRFKLETASGRPAPTRPAAPVAIAPTPVRPAPTAAARPAPVRVAPAPMAMAHAGNGAHHRDDD